jgi:hypothetical protein
MPPQDEISQLPQETSDRATSAAGSASAAETRCQHCGRPPYPGAAEGADGAQPGEPAVDERERELWALVDEAERIRAGAPPAPARTEAILARDAMLRALALRDRVARHVTLVEEALARPSSWLRPVQRFRLVGQLRGRRSAEQAAQEQVARAQAHFGKLRRQVGHRRDYLAMHRETLSAARSARAELDQRADKLIDGYARLPHPPAWFRFGLGYPPRPGEHAEWLGRAREEIEKRRRYGAGAPPSADPAPN